MRKLAVAGCGYWGPNLIRNFNALPDCEVRSICDRDTARLDHMKELYPQVQTSTEYTDLIEDKEIEAIVIATPVSLHYGMARRALEAGKHVFIEKPMASSSLECQVLIELAEEGNRTLMIGHTFLYTPVVQKIKEIVDSGELGEIFYISSRRLNLGLFQKDINVAWDLAPHDLSIILYLFGETPVSVNCQGQAHICEGIEDITNMTLTFENGRMATIQSSWLDPNKVREMTIVGSKKMLVYDDLASNDKIKIYDKRVEAPPHYDTFAEFQYAYHYGDMYAPHVQQVEPLRVECRHFLDSIEMEMEPRSSGRKGMEVVQILEASSRSLHDEGAAIYLSDRISENVTPPTLVKMTG
jgi:predicted dehydrogenase